MRLKQSLTISRRSYTHSNRDLQRLPVARLSFSAIFLTNNANGDYKWLHGATFWVFVCPKSDYLNHIQPTAHPRLKSSILLNLQILELTGQQMSSWTSSSFQPLSLMNSLKLYVKLKWNRFFIPFHRLCWIGSRAFKPKIQFIEIIRFCNQSTSLYILASAYS